MFMSFKKHGTSPFSAESRVSQRLRFWLLVANYQSQQAVLRRTFTELALTWPELFRHLGSPYSIV